MGKGAGDPSNQEDAQSSGQRTPRRRSLYRQGSLSSQIFTDGTDGIILQPVRDGDASSILTGRSGSVSSRIMRARTPSGKSIRSRTASRAEYHMDLKVDLEQGLTRNLLWGCFLIMFGSSFLFGYNIGVLNQPVELIRDFYNETYSNRTGEQVSKHFITIMWSLTTTILFPGGMIGAYSAGFLADKFGRKGATLLSHIPAIIGAVISCVCVVAKTPELLMVGRFISGINCGFATQLAPMYLTEIAPFNLRGAIGTGHQLFITVGIFMGSVFGLKEILGTADLWPYLLLLNAVPALISLIFMPFIPESPRYLMLIKKDRIGAERALRFFFQKLDVIAEIEEMETESNENEDKAKEADDHYTMKMLLKNADLRMPLMVACMLQCIQQLSGINAIFFYSTSIYRNAGVDVGSIPYAVIGTNAVNVIMTIVAVPLIDRLGRRPLLLYPMIVMNVILVIITISLNLQAKFPWVGYISVVCVVAYVICFAVGLGPIPTMIGAELFRQGPRPRAMSLAGLTNWFFTILVAISFESIQELATTYTFLIFLVLMILFTIFTFFKVPETKGKTFEEIANVFQPGGQIEVEYFDDGDESVFGGGPLDDGVDATTVMLDSKATNGSIASNEKNGDDYGVKIPDEKKSLTKSAERIDQLEV